MKLARRLTTTGGALVLLSALAVTVFVSGASATSVAGSGTVTCTEVAGGINFSAPLSLPAGAPGGYGGPVLGHETVNIHLGDCVNSGGSPDAVFTGLNGDSAIDGIATGTITSHSNNIEGLAGSSTPFTLTVDWYGTVGGSALSPTTVTIDGDQAYEGIVNDMGNVGFFLGTTTDSSDYLGSPEVGPAGFQGFETTNANEMPAGTYGWPNPAVSPGGTTTVSATPKAVTGRATATTTLCVSQTDLGNYAYTPSTGEGYNLPGLGGPDSGLLGAVDGNLRDDPISGTGVPADDYISGFNIASGASGCGTGNGSITVSNTAGASHAGVASGSSPSAETITVGEPLTVSSEPPSMGSMTTSGSSPGGESCGSDPGDYVTFEDGPAPDTLCVLKDAGAYSLAGGYGQPPVLGPTAVWVFGNSANDIPPASTSATAALAIYGCTSPLPATVTTADTSCDFASATGSFAATATSASVQGDATTGFSGASEVEGAASGTYNGNGGTDNPDPDGISFIALVATDGLTL